MTDKEHDTETIVNLVRAHLEARTLKVSSPDGKDEANVLILSGDEGLNVQSVKAFLDEYRTEPERRKGTAAVQDLASFTAHVNRFKDADSVIFADKTPASPSLTAVLDYHRKGSDSSPRFGVHRTHYAFPLSDEWLAWNATNGKTMSQEVFAAFLESHLADILDPSKAGPDQHEFAALFGCEFASAAKLLALSKGLTIHVGSKVQSHTSLSSGEVHIQFSEQHSDEKGVPIKIPGAFLLAIPVFRGEAPYRIAVRLRYRVRGPEVAFFYEAHQLSRVFDHAVAEACELVSKSTSLDLFVGKPE